MAKDQATLDRGGHIGGFHSHGDHFPFRFRATGGAVGLVVKSVKRRRFSRA
jgi:hypothetical protein